MIVVENVVYEYPTKRALHGITFAIPPGAIAALVGPNGAGKTTLIRCLVALEAPLSGRVLLDGVDVHRHPREAHRHIGYLSDFFGVYDELTVRQCLAHVAAAQGTDRLRRDSLVEEAAHRLDIADRLGDKAGTLSRGLRQRLAIAQAILHRPRFLVLDEPASGLDPDARYRLSRLLLRLRDEGMTLLVSSHILAELEDYSTEMLILRDGRLVGQRAAGGESGREKRFVAVLASAGGDIAGALAGFDGVRLVRIEGTSAHLALGPDPAVAAEALRRLVAAGLPVVEFREVRERFQDAYIEHLEAASAARAMTGGAP